MGVAKAPAEGMRTFRLGHVRALDGLRGIAILAVLGMNTGAPFARGGFHGVDLFFVLSGFLITSLLLDEQERSGRIHWGRFFARRALRLMPALLVLLVAMVAYTVLFRDGKEAHNAFVLIGAALLYISNWVIAVGGIHGTLEHTWSLGVEGQFYLVWGCVLWWLLRREISRTRLAYLLAGLIAASMLWRAGLWQMVGDVYRVYMGLDTRADALLTGCLVAVLVRKRPRSESRRAPAGATAWALVASVIVGACIVFSDFHSGATYLVAIPLMCLAAGVLIWLVMVHTPRWLERLLEAPLLVWLGTISYSLYLWHVPLGNVLSAERMRGAGLDVIPVGLIQGIAFLSAACCSYYLVERPFLRWKSKCGACGC